MTDNVTSFFDRMGGGATPAAAPVAPALVSSKEDYRAAAPFVAGQERHYLTAYMSNGDERDITYAFHVESISVAPDRLAWVYTNGVLFIRGRNVRALRPLLKERAISELHPFDPEHHKEPEEGAPVIEALEWRYPDQVRTGE